MLTATNVVPAVELPRNLEHLRGFTRGQPGHAMTMTSVDTPMDPSQRDFNPSHVIRYIEKSQGLDWNLFGYVTVVENPRTGERTMINGQHRTSIVKTLAPEVREVPAHVITTDDSQYAAKLFAYLNGVASRSVSREELLWAEIIAGESAALDIERKLRYCDLACDRVNAAPGRRQISRATAEKCFKLSVEKTAVAARLIERAYPKRDNFDNLLHGLVKLLSIAEYDDLTNTNKILGRMFETWFTEKLPEGFTYKESTEIVPRLDPWQNSIAWGLYKKFYAWMDLQGKKNHCPAQEHARSLYKIEDN